MLAGLLCRAGQGIRSKTPVRDRKTAFRTVQLVCCAPQIIKDLLQVNIAALHN